MTTRYRVEKNGGPVDGARGAASGPAAGAGGDTVRGVPAEALQRIQQQVEDAGGEWQEPPEYAGSVGRTMYDLPTSEDNTAVVLLPREHLHALPSQQLARIKSVEDGHTYVGIVVRGPFADPDGLRADTPILVTTTVRGAFFMPRYHGRVYVELLGEELDDGTLVPPRYRPLPNSPVFPLSQEDTARIIRATGDVRLGMAAGHEDVVVAVPSRDKRVLPRHQTVLGTTGGGKSTTIANQVTGMAGAGMAVVLLDPEGEYTTIHEATTDPNMLRALAQRGLAPAGVDGATVYHLVGRETANPDHPRLRPFSLRFWRLSPYAVMEILDLNDAQQERFLKAYDATKRVMDLARIFPASEAERQRAIEVDEQEDGYPKLRLDYLYDVVQYVAARVGKDGEAALRHPHFTPRPEQAEAAAKLVDAETKGASNVASWRAVQGKLGRLRRLGIFDNPTARPIDYRELLRPGHVAVFDLSDTDSPFVNNLVIADLLRGVQQAQDLAFDAAALAGQPLTPAEIVIEEAHEFLSAQRIAKMPVLFQQVARIARRGRKRWLGLVFVTQLPQHLPDEIFGLCNNFVLHKVNDPNVVNRLKRTVGGIDASLWQRLPNLAPGQAIVSFAHMARPLLTAVDPAPCRLRMTD
jgi:DNA helicase HerA-like ATPase